MGIKFIGCITGTSTNYATNEVRDRIEKEISDCDCVFIVLKDSIAVADKNTKRVERWLDYKPFGESKDSEFSSVDGYYTALPELGDHGALLYLEYGFIDNFRDIFNYYGVSKTTVAEYLLDASDREINYKETFKEILLSAVDKGKADC